MQSNDLVLKTKIMDFKEKVLDAYERIRGDIKRTSLEYSTSLSRIFGAEIFFKWENEQVTGSFKIRGALNKLRSLSDREKQKGIVSASTGNHGLALCYASELEGVDLTLILPKSTAEEKIKKLKKYGVSLIFYGSSCEKAEIHARQMAKDRGQVYISPYNDMDIIYGQGTAGIEIIEDLPDVEALVVPVGGGGLISGIAGYCKTINTELRIFGVEPENSQFMIASLKAGRIVDIEEKGTLADAVRGGIEPGSITFPLCQRYVDKIFAVEEPLMAGSMSLVYKEHKKIVEGAGALSLAGLIKEKEIFQGRKVALIISGGNISSGLFQKIVRAC